MQFRLGELFCGPGGLAYGAGLANDEYIKNANGEVFSIVHTWSVDRDPMAIKTYNSSVVKKFGGKGLCLDARDFVQGLTSEQKKIDALAFGFPCNDFSLVGEQKGLDGDFGQLYKTGIAVINQCNPLWFVAENVSGLNSANKGRALGNILKEMQEAGKGYVLTPHLYKFEEYSVPQYRHRFIIVGIRKDLGITFKVPSPTTKNKPISVGEALSNIPLDAPNNENKKVSAIIVNRLLLTPPWHNAWFLDELESMDYAERRNILKKLPWYEISLGKLTDQELLTMLQKCKLHCKKARMSHIYKRLDKNRPSYTVTGSGGGGTHLYHWEEPRALTNRERARIQTFPDDFKFEGSVEQVRKQIGMAVPPVVAKIIFTSLLKVFAGIEYPCEG